MGKQRTVKVQSPTGLPVGAKFSPQTLATVTIAPIPADQPPVLIAGYDSLDGSLRVANLRTWVEALAGHEGVHCLDRLDTRNGVAVTVPNGAGLAEVVTGEIEIDEDEVWYMNRLAVTSPAADADGSCSHNILVSSFPKTGAGTDKPYLAADAAHASVNYDPAAVAQLGEELRVVGPATLTLRLTVTVAFTVAKVFRLDVFGRKGKLLVS